MEVHATSTFFALAERDSPDSIREQYRLLRNNAVAHTLDAIPVMLLVLNQRRQIVLANAQALRATGLDMQRILGLRPGEAFNCIHVAGGPGGCGTSEFCSRCGSIRAILKGLEGEKNIQECSVLRHGDHGVEAVDLEVSASPIEVGGHSCILYCIQDMSHLKRRRTLERLFFHDILNTAGGLRGLTDVLRQEVPESLREDADFIHSALAHLVDELMGQKDLLAAENNELAPAFVSLRSKTVLETAAKMGSRLAENGGKSLVVAEDSADVEFSSDPILLKRVIGNMVKNALEATLSGEQVVLSCAAGDGGLEFAVKNPAVMSDDVRLRVFKRNFSTKGAGRGLGTYGMKLLGERYLGGEVRFASHAPEGTTFTLSLPLDPRSADASRAGKA